MTTDAETSTAIATGFLEALLSESDLRTFDFREIAPMLGPECRSYCVAWDRFTGATTPGL